MPATQWISEATKAQALAGMQDVSVFYVLLLMCLVQPHLLSNRGLAMEETE